MSDKYLTKIVAASLLADGGVYIPKDGSKNAHFVLVQTSDHKDHVDWMDDKLSTLTRTRRRVYKPKPYGTVKTTKERIDLTTGCHPFYTRFRERMYPNGHKVVDPHYLTLLDWEFLAVWYMQDGCNHKIQKTYKVQNAIELCSLNFSYGDNMLLRSALAEKLNMHFRVQKRNGKYWSLFLSQKCVEEFIYGVAPFVQDSFKYKLTLTHKTPEKDEEIVRTVQECTELDRNVLVLDSNLE